MDWQVGSVQSADEFLIIRLPFRGDNAEEHEIAGTGIPYILAFTRWDQDDLADMDLLVFRTDVHLAAPAQNVIEFC